MTKLLILLLFAFLIQACVSTNNLNQPLAINNNELPFNSQHTLKTPRLSAKGNTLLLSWVDVSNFPNTLNYTELKNGQWTPAKTVAQGDNWFINYADYAKVEAVNERHFIASWLEKSSNLTTQYQFKVKQSFDAGETWMTTTSPLSEQGGEHGFVSVVKTPNGAMFNWISEVEGQYQIKASILNANNQWSTIEIVDDASCSCCHTDMANANDRVLSVYRNRTEQEIRDIALNSYQQGQWQQPRVIHQDGWKINGCPVNGPSISAIENNTAIIWYTFATGNPQVKLQINNEHFKNTVVELDNEGIGYVDSAVVDQNTMVFSWLSTSPNLHLNIQMVDMKTAQLSAKKSLEIEQKGIGFPSIAVFEDKLFIVNESMQSAIQTQTIDLEFLKTKNSK